MPLSLEAPVKSAGLAHPLCVALCIALVLLACRSHSERLASDERMACVTENIAREVIVDLGRKFDLEVGALLVLPGTRVVTGVQKSRPARLEDTTPPQRTIRVFHDSLGELPLPDRPGNRPPIDLPVPVALPDGRWGLMWVEAQPDSSSSGSWPGDRFTELWISEWREAGWTAPSLILKAHLYIDWRAHTTIDNQPGGAYAMVLYEEPLVDRRIVFGPVGKDLSPFPVPTGFIPFAATFMRDPDGMITVVVQGRYRSGSDADSLQFIAVSSDDQGTTWSDAEVIWRSSTVGRDLGLFRDAQNTLHLVWTDGWTGTRHIYRSSTTEWTASAVHNSSSHPLFPGVAGIDLCGQMTLIRESWELGPGGARVQLRVDRWRSGSWVVDDRMKDAAAHNLFDGRATDGVWHVAWSDAAPDSSGKVWITTP